MTHTRSSMSFRRKMGTLMAGNAGAQIVTFVFSPLLTRLYSPEDYGRYGVFLSVISIASVFATLRLERGLVVTGSRRERDGLLLLQFWIALMLGIVVYLVSLAWPTRDTRTLDWVMKHQGFLLAAGSALAGLGLTFRCLTLKGQNYGTLSLEDCSRPLVQSGSQALQGWFGIAGGLCIGAVVGYLFTPALLGLVAVRNGTLSVTRFRKLSQASLGAAWRRNTMYPKFMVWSAMLNSFKNQTLVLIMGWLCAGTDTGQMFLAYRTINLPFSFVLRSIDEVIFQEAAEKDPNSLPRFYMKILRKLLLLGFLPCVAMIILSPWAFPFVFGPNWSQAGRMAAFLAPGSYSLLVSTPFMPLYTVLRRQGHYLVISSLRFLLLLGGTVAGLLVFGLEGAAAGFSIGTILGCLATHIHLRILFVRAHD